MISHIDRLREKLRSGQICLGTGVTFTDPTVTESLAARVDFLWIDLEHNPTNLETMQAHLIAARAGGTAAQECYAEDIMARGLCRRDCAEEIMASILWRGYYAEGIMARRLIEK